ncbi:MAG: glutamine--fructose-6-phosphate transaminase (isomerizing) [Candidatus Portnoybacteria bacterium CG_4_10_14_0_2_um_filter_44_20]|uniref:Glutamine--fructose-6-phosphate aminotransferase [isomerizing] n=3 Tax=Candidatus Portnoyibacteriota TaxID=1817913 RepID=A0A2H0KTX9_9BACT|nr:MAG: glutamine--fructose-6-phosphate aminotransferase [Parcubacteria group bacterium CG2_30_44_18]PIQ74755.1 MAG: glutamine--fructose-6-phosphate transaminase (isomerizing) [Candidatus Portnoybacteria bacterium CG11_big_fil_rev_8_21_14_0_20_44_10]PIZ70675.1 MAG: glutamine--fructose-6-phosphate transaminase (isomerizing) [Candidatus Portnoybacteria bacterium CG_4_10_14_0_2_um_filter_44_20]
MCGIAGYIGKNRACPILIDGLRRLEYRGYDSAGFALAEDGGVVILKAVGRVEELEKQVGERDFLGTAGIAHTRWATHGKPSKENAHPHVDCRQEIFLVHNGIIENYKELKESLKKRGHRFSSETDSEVIAHLIEEYYGEDSLEEAVRKALLKATGTYGIAVLSQREPNKIVAARKGSPLILGVGKDEFIIASDVAAIIRYTDRVVYLNDGEMVVIGRDGYEVSNLERTRIDKRVDRIDWSVEKAEKQGFAYFMLKEIFEQPEAIKNAIRGRVLSADGNVKLGGLDDVRERLREINRLVIVACGTAYHAGLVGKYMLEEYAGIRADIEYGSEFRYRKPILDSKTAVLAVSQSGETADTLAAVKEAKNKGALALGIVNAVGSTIARETDAGIYNHAGPEIGVASTKAFTSQLSILALLTVFLGRQREMSCVTGKRILNELAEIERHIKTILKQAKEIEKIARKYSGFNNFLYLGRKYNYPIALEGALKIKEIAYVHAEGYPFGEMKHGSIALIDENFPSIAIVTKDSVYEKTISGVQEIKARGGKIIAIATSGDKEIKKLVDDVIYIPKTLEMLTPMISVVPLQLLAYYFGVQKGLDVDKPRNLAKSVTVE